MPTPYLSEIKLMSVGFAPSGWALCNGQTLLINQNQALFALLGTTYGGNGTTTFALPDLRGRVPIHRGNGYTIGERAGQEAHTLTINELPQHTHFVTAKAPSDGSANVNNPNGAFLSNSAPAEIYNSGAGGASFQAMRPESLTNIGGSQPHTNMQPTLVLSYCIALQGVFPSQS